MSLISIIICSRKKTLTYAFSKNIEETIGCEFELIVIDNSQNTYSIFEAYNLGIAKSTSKYLCFVHDDIRFHTQNWGIIVDEIFAKNDQIGLIGIAGAKTKTKMPSAWWDCPKQNQVVNVLQHRNESKIEKWNFGFKSEKWEEVVVIDGVFMAMKRIKNFQFQTKLQGFHNYDLNISFEMNKLNKKIVVTNRLLIEHFSMGNIDESWLESTYQIHKLYEDVLPLSTNSILKDKQLEINNSRKFINQSLQRNQLKLAFVAWIALFWLAPFLKFHLKFLYNLLKKILC